MLARSDANFYCFNFCPVLLCRVVRHLVEQRSRTHLERRQVRILALQAWACQAKWAGPAWELMLVPHPVPLCLWVRRLQAVRPLHCGLQSLRDLCPAKRRVPSQFHTRFDVRPTGYRRYRVGFRHTALWRFPQRNLP